MMIVAALLAEDLGVVALLVSAQLVVVLRVVVLRVVVLLAVVLLAAGLLRASHQPAANTAPLELLGVGSLSYQE